MKLTKYAHACLVLEHQGKKIIIDPGEFSPDFGDANNVVAIVVTHVHPDHFDPTKLASILAKNPDAKLFTTHEVQAQFDRPNVETPQTGDKTAVGPFTLEFFGEKHAVIHDMKPAAQNIGVMINDVFYYPGDILLSPERPVKVLACPSIAPWQKMSETIDFLGQVKPTEFFFPTHNALLSDVGHEVYEKIWLNNGAEHHGLTQKILNPGDSVEISRHDQ